MSLMKFDWSKHKITKNGEVIPSKASIKRELGTDGTFGGFIELNTSKKNYRIAFTDMMLKLNKMIKK